MEGKKIWNTTLNDLKDQISLSNFKTWFSGANFLDFKEVDNGRILVIGVRNSFIKEQIEARYKNEILSILNRCAPETNIEIVVQKGFLSEGTETAPLFSGKPLNLNVSGNSRDAFANNLNFDNYVVGVSNNLAYLAATQVASNLGAAYNPLLFYGPTGVGKTHLLLAIASEAKRANLDVDILYVNAEKFTNDYIESLRNKTQAAFRFKYRKVDLLLVDVVQFLAGKESTQDEFFHTFNDLHLSNKQIVLACDRNPKELGRLKERLASRFLGGLTCDIALPDLEMKIAILKAKCQEKGVSLGDRAISFIAESTKGGVRELEGVLVSAIAASKLSGSFDLSKIKDVLEKREQDRSVKPTPGELMIAVSKHYKVSLEELKNASRKATFVRARQVLIFLLRKELSLPLATIGDLLGGRDHSTVIHSIDKIEQLILRDKTVSDEILRVKSMVGANY